MSQSPQSRTVALAWGAFALGAILTAGCASNRRDEPFTRSPDVSKPDVHLGQIVFYQNCNVCHPGGSSGYGPSLNALAAPAWYVHFRVRNGLGAMPSFDQNKLSEARLNAVTIYLKALRGESQ